MMDRLTAILERYNELGERMASPDVVSDAGLLQRYAREHAQLSPIVDLFGQLRRTEIGIEEARDILSDGADEDLRDLARDELRELETRRQHQTEELKRLLVPRDPNDEKNAIMEIRGSAGGEEANLFAQELFRLYTSYAERQRWHVEILDLTESDLGGVKEVIFEVRGPGAYGRLKYESGVHRVQRVPVTESGGRIHTSTASVIVLPEAEDVDVEIRPDDLRIDVFRSHGHGGQGVNTTDSAVRVTHLPTGIVVTCQNERSQIQNRASAMAVLRSRLYALEQERREKELGAARKSQVASGERSEKIRTYNFPQDRVTDHRVNLTLHNLPGIMQGNIDQFISALELREQQRLLDDEGM
ncbi:MAG TPA: peptide chain release factor 1 [Chloroflexota bacterium]|nr:peptide chain release factor 1 [Chloroflexota bacterium]